MPRLRTGTVGAWDFFWLAWASAALASNSLLNATDFGFRLRVKCFTGFGCCPTWNGRMHLINEPLKYDENWYTYRFKYVRVVLRGGGEPWGGVWRIPLHFSLKFQNFYLPPRDWCYFRINQGWAFRGSEMKALSLIYWKMTSILGSYVNWSWALNTLHASPPIYMFWFSRIQNYMYTYQLLANTEDILLTS